MFGECRSEICINNEGNSIIIIDVVKECAISCKSEQNHIVKRNYIIFIYY